MADGILGLLTAPLKTEWVAWRVTRVNIIKRGSAAYVVPYIRAHACRELLNTLVGPQNWMAEFSEMPSGAIICRLSIWTDNRWVYKEDCAGIKGAMRDKENQLKGGYSDAFKRAARAWGIGDKLASIGEIKIPLYDRQTNAVGEKFHAHKDKASGGPTYYYWVPPSLPKGQTLDAASWEMAAKDAAERYALHLTQSQRPDTVIVRDIQPQYVQPEIQDQDQGYDDVEEDIQDECPDDDYQDDAEAIEEIEEIEAIEPDQYPIVIDEKALVDAINRELEKARSLFSASQFGNKVLELRSFQSKHQIKGFKIKSPEQTKEGWNIYCQPADVRAWINVIKGWGK